MSIVELQALALPLPIVHQVAMGAVLPWLISVPSVSSSSVNPARFVNDRRPPYGAQKLPEVGAMSR